MERQLRPPESERVQRWHNDGNVQGGQAKGGGSGVQQRFQPEQTDDESDLLELEIVRNEWRDGEQRKG